MSIGQEKKTIASDKLEVHVQDWLDSSDSFVTQLIRRPGHQT